MDTRNLDEAKKLLEPFAAILQTYLKPLLDGSAPSPKAIQEEHLMWIKLTEAKLQRAENMYKTAPLPRISERIERHKVTLAKLQADLRQIEARIPPGQPE